MLYKIPIYLIQSQHFRQRYFGGSVRVGGNVCSMISKKVSETFKQSTANHRSGRTLNTTQCMMHVYQLDLTEVYSARTESGRKHFHSTAAAFTGQGGVGSVSFNRWRCFVSDRRSQRICTTIGIAVLTSCFSCSRAPTAQYSKAVGTFLFLKTFTISVY